jgi:hypothetical protein
MAANATAVWRVRPSGSNTNGGGYDAGISGAGTDYSQQNAAQVSQSSTANTSTATTTLTDLGASFTSALIGNAIRVSGTGITTTYTFIIPPVTSTTLTLQTSPGTTGTAVSYSIGGGWADFWTNTTSSGPVVPGNTIYVLGSGVPNPALYNYDYSPSTYINIVSGSATAGRVAIIGDPNTPSSGVPCIKVPGILFNGQNYGNFANLWFVLSSGGSNGIFSNASIVLATNVVLDQYGYDGCFNNTGIGIYIVASEAFSSRTKQSTNVNYVLGTNYGTLISGCNIHNCIGPALLIASGGAVTDTLITKNGGAGLTINPGGDYGSSIKNCTIDGNLGSGVVFTTQTGLANANLFNCIISNHTQSGTYGMTVSAGTTSANNLIKGFVDYNTYWNNTTDLNVISYGAHDTSNSGSAPILSTTNPYRQQPPMSTNGATAAGNNTLHFASVPATVLAGMPILDTTAPTVLVGLTVVSTTSTTVVMSGNASGAGVGNGDSIVFAPEDYTLV